MEGKKNLNIAAAMKGKGYRNFPMVPRVVYGKGSFDQLGDILTPFRERSGSPMVFLVDDVFENSVLAQRVPSVGDDMVIMISAAEEPKTKQVDALVEKIRSETGDGPSGIVGIGGGTLLDLAKAVAIMLNNPGKSESYQGWDLVKHPAVYHVGVPTLSGTGAEVSRTAVLSGPERKLGINSDYTPFDQVVLDPDLTRGVPKDQWFYTGMDCFIHCIESLNGEYLNAFSKSYGEESLKLCEEVFLGDLEPSESREKLMMASWHGGMSIAYSQVGVAHALSYGLSYVMGTPHGLGNCLVFQHLDKYYPHGVAQFREMCSKHDIVLPQGVCAGVSEEDFQTMARVSLGMAPLWENALGKDWQQKVGPAEVLEIFEKI